MTQESLEKYLVENAKKMSEAIERWNDDLSIGILLYLAREEVAPIYELENVFGKYISTEEGIMKIAKKLKDIGLLDVYEGRMLTNGTTIVRLTPFGKEVSQILEGEEIRREYPITKKILVSILLVRLEQKHSDSRIDEKGLVEFLKSDETVSDAHEAINRIISEDFVSSQLVRIYRSFI